MSISVASRRLAVGIVSCAVAVITLAPTSAESATRHTIPRSAPRTGSSWKVSYTWTTPSPTRSILFDLACPSEKDCVGLGAVLTSTGPGIEDISARYELGTSTDGGSKWRWTKYAVADQPGALACESTKVCVVVGSGPTGGIAFGTTNGGASWHAMKLPSDTPILWSVACTKSSCDAVGGAPYQGVGTVTSGVIDRVIGGAPRGHRRSFLDFHQH